MSASKLLDYYFEHHDDACVLLDSDGKVNECNLSFVEIAGLPREEILGKSFASIFDTHKGDAPILKDAKEAPFVFRSSVISSSRKSPVCDWKVAKIADAGFAISGRPIDVQNANADLVAPADKRLAAVLETTVDGIITIDHKSTIVTANRAALRIFQYDAEELIGSNVKILMPAPYRDEHDDYVNHYLATGQRRIIGIGREVSGLRKDGTIFPLDLAVSEVKTAGTRFFTGIVRDISQRRELEREILRISEEERRRIGQDLHDELGQMLTGTGLLALNLTKQLKQQDAPGAAELSEITKFIKEADQYARTLARGLVPVELEAHGLSAALLRLSQDAGTLFGIDCSYKETGEIPLRDSTKAIHLFRIAQEAISNACKHGHASRVNVELVGSPERLRLRIRDNGSGFADDWQESAGMGVHIMQYRAKLIGGSLDIVDIPEGGTTVQCQVRL